MASLAKIFQESSMSHGQVNYARGCLISEEDIEVAANKWLNSLIDKIISKYDIDFDKVQRDVNVIWGRHRRV